MNEMVERVGRAIYESGGGKDWDQQISWVHEQWFKMARAAIQAMSEPTEGMIEVGGEAVWESNHQKSPAQLNNAQASLAATPVARTVDFDFIGRKYLVFSTVVD